MDAKPKRRLTPRGSKAKGSDYEREVAAYLNEKLGLRTRRALLSGGGRNDGGADLDGMPFYHLELKRTETFAPYAAMKQAEEAISKAPHKRQPVVINRRNRMTTGESLVVMRLDDWMELLSLRLKHEPLSASIAWLQDLDSASTRTD